MRYLTELGVFAYRGATQLSLVEPDAELSAQTPTLKPQSAVDNPVQAQDISTTNKGLHCAVNNGVGKEKGNDLTMQGHDISKKMICDSSTKALPTSSHSEQIPVNSHTLQTHNTHDAGLDSEPLDTATKSSAITPKSEPAGGMASEKLKKYFQQFPHEAKYLIDHVVYLPVNRLVPFTQLDRLADCVTIAVQKSMQGKRASNHIGYKLKLKSSL